ncbi:HEXXH motif domain-containing protein [Nocardia tengchongensis]|uniref:HEXXH motif domain-containing protein n=1 Tax=Nocardia tengchongensis TaxID=2055889 RepID=UPI003622C9C7
MPGAAPEIDTIIMDLSSGYGSAESVAALTDGMLGVRMILLRTLIDTLDADAPETAATAGIHEAYRTLADLQLTHQDTVATMLCYPHTGPWLTHVLGRTTAEPGDCEVPLWADCGYLGWLAAAACITCLPEGTMRLVIRNGVIMLPTLGLAQLTAEGYNGPCELRWTATGTLSFTWAEGSIDIDSPADESHPQWLPLRRIHAADGEPHVWLDDLDPFRHLMPAQTPPPRLDAEQARIWQRDFADAWHLLRDNLRQYLPPMRSALRSLAPLSAKPVVASTSHTASHGVGCVYTTAPADRCQLALTLIHEIQHTKFNLLTDQVQLFDADPGCRFYAPWRDDPRPIFGLLHGIYAFFGVTDFWRVHRNSDCHGSQQAHTDFELWRAQVAVAVGQAQTSGLLTAEGHRFINALAQAMLPWQNEPIPPEAVHAAAEAMTAHRTFWRVRNLEPDPAWIADLATRWAANQPPSAEVAAVTHTDQRRIPNHHRQLPLAALLKTTSTAAPATRRLPGQLEGDRAYLAGYRSEAVALYTRELRTDPLRPQAWAGLALAVPKIFGADHTTILSERAEVAARLYRAVGPETDPLKLLRWLS